VYKFSHWRYETQSLVKSYCTEYHKSQPESDFHGLISSKAGASRTDGLLSFGKPETWPSQLSTTLFTPCMFPSFSQRGKLKAERSSRALALGDSISSFQYDFTLDDDNDNESVTGVSFADETSISNLDELFQRSFTVDVSFPDLVSSSLRTDFGSSSLTNQDGSPFEVQSPFGVPVDDLLRSFEEHLNSQDSLRNKVLKKRHRSRRGFGSSHGCSRYGSENVQLDPAFLSPKRDVQSSWNEDASDHIGDEDVHMQLRGKRHSVSLDYLPATRQQSLPYALTERSVSQRTLIGSPSPVSRQ
jgi:hypothetical protein